MLKSISNIGTILNKTEQKEISGGVAPCPEGTRRICIGIPPRVACFCHPVLSPGEELTL